MTTAPVTLEDQPLRLAVFDCDGTLLDGQHTVITAMRAAFQPHGPDLPADEAVRAIIGLNLVEGIERLIGGRPGLDPLAIAEGYRAAYRTQREVHGAVDPMYHGIADTLDALEAAGVLLAVATGKTRRGLDSALAAHGIADRFVSLQTGDQPPGKPHPAMLERALAETGVEAAQAVMIGDTTYDMLMARSAGVQAIGVAWGYHPVDALRQAGAQAIVANPVELAAVALARLGVTEPAA